MIKLRLAPERGHADHGWLNSWHSFSFAGYQDPEHTQFRSLRVINEDTVQPGQGFGTHGHSDMEIVSYVLEGGLAHQDSSGGGSVLSPGSVQRMSAGTGVRHSEFNASKTDVVHFLQIWFIPNKTGIPPGYEEKYFDDTEKRGKLRLVASPNGADGSVTIQANAKMYAALLDGNERIERPIAPDHDLYIHLARGRASVNFNPVQAGDAVMLIGEERLLLDQGQDAEVLVFELW